MACPGSYLTLASNVYIQRGKCTFGAFKLETPRVHLVRGNKQVYWASSNQNSVFDFVVYFLANGKGVSKAKPKVAILTRGSPLGL